MFFFPFENVTKDLERKTMGTPGTPEKEKEEILEKMNDECTLQKNKNKKNLRSAVIQGHPYA